MPEELTEKEFYSRELVHNDTFKYLNASQRRMSYLKYLEAHKQAEEMRTQNAYRERLKQERVAEQKRLAEDLAKRQIESLGPLQSAKIARQVTASFDISEILDVIDFFDSADQLYKAVAECHASLEPQYRQEIIAWFLANTDLESNKLEASNSVDEIVARCMHQGLSAVCKTDALKQHLGDHKQFLGGSLKAEGTSASRIEKRRSWTEISAEGN